MRLSWARLFEAPFFCGHESSPPGATVQYLRQYRDTVHAGRTAFDDERPAAIPDDLVRAILDARKPA